MKRWSQVLAYGQGQTSVALSKGGQNLRRKNSLKVSMVKFMEIALATWSRVAASDLDWWRNFELQARISVSATRQYSSVHIYAEL